MPYWRHGFLSQIATAPQQAAQRNDHRSLQLACAAGPPPRPTGEERPGQLDGDRRLARGRAVTEAELDVFEAWFGDLFDELFWSAPLTFGRTP